MIVSVLLTAWTTFWICTGLECCIHPFFITITKYLRQVTYEEGYFGSWFWRCKVWVLVWWCLLAVRVHRWHTASQDKRKGAHMSICIVLPFSHKISSSQPWGCTLMNLSNPNHFPNVLSLNPIVRLRFFSVFGVFFETETHYVVQSRLFLNLCSPGLLELTVILLFHPLKS